MFKRLMAKNRSGALARIMGRRRSKRRFSSPGAGERGRGDGKGSVRLSGLKPGQRGRIVKIETAGPMRRRLMDMGVLVGEEIRVEKIAPLGDPMEVSVKNYRLSFRKKEADGVLVELES